MNTTTIKTLIMLRFLPCNAMLAWYMLLSCVPPSVGPSVTCQYYTKMLNIESCKRRHMIAHGFQFSGAKDLSEILTGSPSLKGVWSGHVNHLNFGGRQPYGWYG